MKAFEKLLSLLVLAPIVQSLDFSLPFEIMRDAYDLGAGTILGQRVNRMPHAIYYAKL